MNNNTFRIAGEAIANAQVADRKRGILYRPEYNEITGSVTASIFLQQIWYWWSRSGRKPFYKFRGPCKDKRYRVGDSWTEELGFTRRQFETARKGFANKITKGANRTKIQTQSLVIYWTDSNRLTWYMLNEKLFFESLGQAYAASSSESPPLDEARNALPLDEAQSVLPLISEIIPEINTETNIKIEKTAAEKRSVPVPASTGEKGNGKQKRKRKRTTASPKPAKPDGRAWFVALAETCLINLSLATATQKQQLGQSAKLLRKAAVTPEQITAFRQWWNAEDWRGRKGQSPAPAQVRAEWGKFAATSYSAVLPTSDDVLVGIPVEVF